MKNLFFILALLIAGAAIIAVYDSERRYDTAEAEARAVEREISSVRRDIHMLNVEWSYQTRPERLQELSLDLLDLKPAPAMRLVRGEAALPAAIDRLYGLETVGSGGIPPVPQEVRR